MRKSPWRDENREYVAAQVEDPYRPGTFESVIVNGRESNARTLRLGKAQTEAYDRVWALYYRAGYHRQGAVDPSNEPVDCSRSADPIPMRVAQANQELSRLRVAVGDEHWVFIEMSCKYGHGYKDIAHIKHGREPARTEVDETVFQVKAAWNKVMIELGLAETPTWYARLQSYLPGGRTGFDKTQWEAE